MSDWRGLPSIGSLFLSCSFQPSDRLAVLMLNRKENHVIQRIAPASALAAADVQKWLGQQNQRGYDVYISMNALRADAIGRTKADVETIRHIYLDFDSGGINAVESMLRKPGMPKVNNLFHTSPDHWQVIWRASGFTKTEAEELQRGMARIYGADLAATDCARVLRLPGFINHKHGDSHRVAAEFFARNVYSPGHFPTQFPHDRTRPESIILHKGPYGQVSQSEKDWAYAKRALARGEAPEQVADAIAQYRQDDKANPRYYADLTVRKAQENLAAEKDRFDTPDR